MKQNIIISTYQIIAVTLCAYLVINFYGFSYPTSLVYIVRSILHLNIVGTIVFWKKLGHSPRSRQAESLMLIVSSFTPIVSYYTLLDGSIDLLKSLTNVIGMFALGQFIWVVSIYICPDIVGLIRIRKNESNNQ